MVGVTRLVYTYERILPFSVILMCAEASSEVLKLIAMPKDARLRSRALIEREAFIFMCLR